jgi:hypothetical protein
VRGVHPVSCAEPVSAAAAAASNGDRGRSQYQRTMAALHRLSRWRAHFAGWQLGTRPLDDPEAQAVRDHREATMFLRAEVTALTALLREKGVFTESEQFAALQREADALCEMYEQRWPGARASDTGMSYDLAEAAQWMKGWLP